MHWLVQIAAMCPQLTSIDLSNVPYLGNACPVFLYGYQSLAGILRARGGRFTSANEMPVSAVLVNDDKIRDGQFVHDAYFVTRIDWGREEIDVANYVNQRDMASVPDKPDMNPAHFSLVPFADLVGGYQDQAKWAIRDLSIRVVSVEWLALVAEDSRKDDRDTWIESEPRLYKRAGIRKGKDRVFDLNPATTASHPTIKGKVVVATPYLHELRQMMQARGIDPRTQCTQVELHGSNTMVSWMSLMNKPDEFKISAAEKVAQLRSLSLNPLFTLCRFAVHDAYFFTPDQTNLALEAMSKAMPNLLDLSLLNLQVPMDFALMAIDTHFIRRMPQDGKRLQLLRVSCFCPMHEDPVWYSNSANQLGIKAASNKLFDFELDAAMDLRTLALEASGSTYNLKPSKQPQVAIHPDLLRQLESLTVESVTLVQIHPELLHATRSAFMPARAIANFPASLDQTLEHAILPKLRRLQVSTSTLMREPRLHLPTSLPVPTRGPPRLHRPTSNTAPVHAKSLPSCPQLDELFITANGAPAELSALLVSSILAKYPTLSRASLAFTNMSKGDVQQLARTLWDRVSGTHPRLRHLVLEIMCANGGYMRYMSMPHVLDTVALASDAMRDLKPTSVEVDLQPPRPWCDREGKLVECGTCRMKVRVESPRSSTRGLFMDLMGGGRGARKTTSAGHVPSPEAVAKHCPNCAPSGFERVWVMQSGGADTSKVAKPSQTEAAEEVLNTEEGNDDGQWEDWCSDDDADEEKDVAERALPGATMARAEGGARNLWGIKMRFPGEF
ncbi:hypothetical protein BCR44DRAFT_1001106 [Catenaria anguillulae PL171]|uniref:Uncharacterized protein n=1 Tax=Catenaria anguillulae PL171 TaxID=765915 RepID=A0A1Y2I3B1_9FUNG|nr:hypothetical protein BCR44DRAFT_1001106 [Catenaria anguillulae PL171]